MIARMIEIVRRRALMSRLKYWRDVIETLDRQQQSHASHMAHACGESAKIRRALSWREQNPATVRQIEPRRENNADGLSIVDGVQRFSLVNHERKSTQ